MLARIRKAQEHKDSGFTLIELLVVMIIIGILAAIAIPAFLSQKTKARDTSAKADVSTIGKEIAAYYVDGTDTLTIDDSTAGEWALEDAASTVIASGKLSTGNAVTAGTITSDTTFCVSVVNGDDDASPYQYSAEGLAPGDCTP